MMMLMVIATGMNMLVVLISAAMLNMIVQFVVITEPIMWMTVMMMLMMMVMMTMTMRVIRAPIPWMAMMMLLMMLVMMITMTIAMLSTNTLMVMITDVDENAYCASWGDRACI